MSDILSFLVGILQIVLSYLPGVTFLTFIFSLVKYVKWENCPRRRKKWKICAIVSGSLPAVFALWFVRAIFEAMNGAL